MERREDGVWHYASRSPVTRRHRRPWAMHDDRAPPGPRVRPSGITRPWQRQDGRDEPLLNEEVP